MLPWERIRAFAATHGVVTTPVGFTDLNRLPVSPFSKHLTIQWKAKKLYIDKEHLHDPAVVGGMIHELGHLIATTKRPYYSDELSFVGWEWQVAKVCRVLPQWNVNMRDYHIENPEPRPSRPQSWWEPKWYEFVSYSSLTPVNRRKVLLLSVERGKTYGNLSCKGEPLAVR